MAKIKDSTSIENTRSVINQNINKIEEIIKKYDVVYNISYGENYFPTKEYKGTVYDSGNYESLLITLGEGIGDNFWCVLYPPLCLIENQDNLDNKIYKSYIKDVLFKTN